MEVISKEKVKIEFVLVETDKGEFRVYESGYVEYFSEHDFYWHEYGTWGKDYDEVKAVGLEVWNGEAK